MISGRNKTRLAFITLLIVGVLCVFFVFPQYFSGLGLSQKFTKPFVLGLDLQGGTHLVYEANSSQMKNIPFDERMDALQGVRDVIERRVNTFGVSEPLVQTSQAGESYRIIVELAGVHDVNTAIKMIGETPLLEFKESATTTPELLPEEQQQIDTYNENAKERAEEILSNVLKEGSDFNELAKEFSEEPGASETAGVLGFLGRGNLVPEFEEVCFDTLADGQIYDSLVETDFGYHIIKKLETRNAPVSDISDQDNINNDPQPLFEDESNQDTSAEDDELLIAEQDDSVKENATKEFNCQHILVRTHSIYDIRPDLLYGNWKNTQLSGEQLKSAAVSFNQTGFPEVTLTFNSEGDKLFEEITKRNIDKQVAIFLDNEPISTPVVQTIITGGTAVISGNFSLEEAKLLAQRLNAGALRVPIELISQKTVGSSLGRVSVEKSFSAAIIGLLLVALFMIFYYRLPGVLAVIALGFYGLIVLALFKLIPVTLSLAGIAGFILSIGMAVDANVLIFERLKEELRKKYSLDVAINTAFKRAWTSIRDGNVSTLITCLILIWFSESIVKGFAITLSVGILISMFSSMTITKLLLTLTRFKFLSERTAFYGVKRK